MGGRVYLRHIFFAPYDKMLKPIFNLQNIESWQNLSFNPKAEHILRLHPDKIDIYGALCCDTDNFDFVLSFPDLMTQIDIYLQQNVFRFTKNGMPIDPVFNELKFWSGVCFFGNKTAMKLLERYPEKIHWVGLSSNKNAVELLYQNLDKIDWMQHHFNENADFSTFPIVQLAALSANHSKAAISLLERRVLPIKLSDHDVRYIDWDNLSKNKFAIDILKTYSHLVNWTLFNKTTDDINYLRENPELFRLESATLNPCLIPLIEEQIERLKESDWLNLAFNPNGIDLIARYWNRIIAEFGKRFADQLLIKLCMHGNAKAVQFIEAKMTKLDYGLLCANPNAIHLVAPLDHSGMINSNVEFKEELIAAVLNPDRLIRIAQQYQLSLQMYIELVAI